MRQYVINEDLYDTVLVFLKSRHNELAIEKKVLEFPVKPDVSYRKEQGTLIVWSENETRDLALSFEKEDEAGCSALWERICHIQGKDPTATEEAEEDVSEPEPSDSSAEEDEADEEPSDGAADLQAEDLHRSIEELVRHCVALPRPRGGESLLLDFSKNIFPAAFGGRIIELIKGTGRALTFRMSTLRSNELVLDESDYAIDVVDTTPRTTRYTSDESGIVVEVNGRWVTIQSTAEVPRKKRRTSGEVLPSRVGAS